MRSEPRIKMRQRREEEKKQTRRANRTGKKRETKARRIMKQRRIKETIFHFTIKPVIVSGQDPPSIYVEPGHHVAVIPRFSAHVDGPPIAPLIWVCGLYDVRLVDENICLCVGRVHPLSTEVLGQQAPGGDGLLLDCWGVGW